GVQIVLGELPFERCGDLFVVLLEVEQAGLGVAEVAEVVGRNDFTLDDGEVDLHLIKPGGVDGQVDQPQGGPAVFEPVDGGLAAVGGAVVDHPEHPAGRGVGLAGHHLLDEPVERLDAGGVFAAAEHLGAVHVPSRQVGERAAAGVFVLDTHRPARRRWCGGVFADAGLDGGLLVGGDHELVRPQRCVVEAAGVEVEDTGRLGTEVGVAGEDPGPMLPRLYCIRTQPAPDRGARDRGDDAGLDGGAGPPSFSPDVVVAIKALACELPAKTDTPLARWQSPDLARAAVESGIVASISGTTIWRWLSSDAIKPWQHRSWIF